MIKIEEPEGAWSLLCGPIVIRDVYVGDDEGDGIGPVENIRIRQEHSDEEWPGRPFRYVLEFEVRCQNPPSPQSSTGKMPCGASNWVQFGTDPSEYRCVQCADWL
jgi:hypothetical protein